jgi:monothiol glutaredoxin
MCGFSGRAVQILKACGADDLKTFNVLEDEECARASRTTPVADHPAALRQR